MQGWGRSGGFSVHADFRTVAHDRAGRERLLRYCGPLMFAGKRLVWAGGGEHARCWFAYPALQLRNGGMQGTIELLLSAGEFLVRIAGVILPPRKHRYRYLWVFVPNSPWRALVAGSKAPRPKTVRAVADCG